MNMKSLLSRIASSASILIVLMLVAVDLAITQIKPLRFISMNVGFTPLDQNPLVAKLPKFFASADNPDVLLLGSSHAVVPAVRTDDAMMGREARDDTAYRRSYIASYTHAVYLERLLRRNFDSNLRLVNMGVVAGMMSDHYLVLRKAIASGKHPKLTICVLAPRDFVDNLHGRPQDTPVYQVLGDLSTINDFAESNSFDQRMQFAVSAVWNFYKLRADYRETVKSSIAMLTGHPKDLFTAAMIGAKPQPGIATTVSASVSASAVKTESTRAGSATSTPAKAPAVAIAATSRPELVNTAIAPPSRPRLVNTMSDLAEYNRVYNPANENLFTKQVSYLEKMLAMADANNITLAFVNMPLTKQNEDLLGAERATRYKQVVAELIKKHGQTFYDFDQPSQYGLDDYEDSCHLNAQGGRKFYNELVRQLSSNSAVVSAVACQRDQIGKR